MYEKQQDVRPFKLSEEFLTPYKTQKPDFGFNGLGELTYKRTYARILPDGTKEDWWQTIRRVIEGVYTMQKKWIVLNNLGWDNRKAQASAQEMYDRMFTMKFLPSGRGLWAWGSPITEERGLYMALNSCAMVSTENIKENPAEPFCFLMDASMLGVGVGFDTRGAGKLIVNQPRYNPDNIYQVTDDREGWVISIEKLINSYLLPNQDEVHFDYSLIRPEGSPINGFGGISAGYQGLEKLHKQVKETLNKNIGEKITVRTIVDIMNMIGACVVSGNVRRTALISFGEPEDDEFLNLKNYKLNPERAEYGWTSNNSVFAKIGMDYSAVAERIRDNGEPGILWLENARAYSRMCDAPDWKDRRVVGCNPCVSGNTRILTKDGYPQIKDVVGKKVSVWNGNGWSEVTPRITGYNKKLLKITFSDGSILECTPEHEFSINTYKNKHEKIMAKNLKVGDKLCKKNIDTKDSIGIHDKYAYELGLFAGDGYVDGKYLRVVAFDKNNILDNIWTNGLLSPIHEGKRKSMGLRILNITKLINNFDMAKQLNDKSEGLPEYLFTLDINSILEFIAGWIDTDGCVAKNENTYRFTLSGGEKKIRDAQLLCNKIGLEGVTIRESSAKGTKTNFGTRNYSLWELSIPSNQCSTIPTRLKVIPSDKIGSKNRINNAHPNSKISVIARQKISKIEEIDGLHTTYCFNEPINHMGIFGNVLTYQCGEQSLENQESCLLAESFPDRHVDFEDYKRTLKFAYLYAKTVTLAKTHWENTNRVMLRNRRIGLSMSGLAQFITNRGLEELRRWCVEGYQVIKHYDEVYSDWLAIPKSIKVTTVKPSGTVSLLAGATPGIHYPESQYYIRRVRLSKHSDLIEPLKNAGYKIEPAIGQEDSTLVVEFPVTVGDKIRTVKDVSMWEQLALGAFMQKYWSDNQVSQTVTFDPETEGKDIVNALNLYQYQLKGVSFLPRVKEGAYPQMPYEEITKEEYEQMVANLKPLDFSSSREDAIGEKYCSNDVCTI